jgi:hypothetical protein
MHRRQRTFAELLTRSLAVAGLVYAFVIAYAVPVTLLAETPGPMSPTPGASPMSPYDSRATWKRAHAERFPGCVDMAEWTAAVEPRSVVVVRRGGDLRQMPFDEAFRRATSPSAADDVWVVGGCR